MTRPGRVGRSATRGRCVLAPNPGIMTLDGTNTWVLREPGRRAGRSWSTPARRSTAHLDAVAEAAGEVGRRAADPPPPRPLRGGARRSPSAWAAAVRALDPAYRLGARASADGDVVEVDGLELPVVGTPGHTADSLSFLLPAERPYSPATRCSAAAPRWSPTPTASSAPTSRLARPAARARVRPRAVRRSGRATGRCIPDALAALDYYRSHRQRAAAAGRGGPGLAARRPAPRGFAADELPRRVVEIVYADVDPVLWGAAELSVRAQLDYLAHRS